MIGQGVKLENALGGGTRPAVKKKEKWMREKSSSAHADLDALNTPLLTFWKETRWWLTHPWINWLIIKYYEYSNLRFCIFTITSTILHQSEIHEPIYILISYVVYKIFWKFWFVRNKIISYPKTSPSNIFGWKSGPVLICSIWAVGNLLFWHP